MDDERDMSNPVSAYLNPGAVTGPSGFAPGGKWAELCPLPEPLPAYYGPSPLVPNPDSNSQANGLTYGGEPWNNTDTIPTPGTGSEEGNTGVYGGQVEQSLPEEWSAAGVYSRIPWWAEFGFDVAGAALEPGPGLDLVIIGKWSAKGGFKGAARGIVKESIEEGLEHADDLARGLDDAARGLDNVTGSGASPAKAVDDAAEGIDNVAGSVAKGSRSSNPIENLFADNKVPKASDIAEEAEKQGWKKVETTSGPIKYVDDNDVTRVTMKKGSQRTPGSENPHVEVRDATGQRIDPVTGDPVTRKSPENHRPIEWDIE